MDMKDMLKAKYFTKKTRSGFYVVEANTVTSKTYDLFFKKQKDNSKERHRAQELHVLFHDLKKRAVEMEKKHERHKLNKKAFNYKVQRFHEKKHVFKNRWEEVHRQVKLERHCARANTAAPKELTCVVCLTKPRTTCFSICRHFAVCGDCNLKLEKCPICNSASHKRMRVYLS